MGPEKNPELFKATAIDAIPSIKGEFIRHNLIAPTLTELAEQFDAKDNTSSPLTEPILFTKLFALSMVQRSRMGITGFDPLRAFDHGGGVKAKAAPYHDEFTPNSDQFTVFRTRAIQLTLPDHGIDNDVKIFGINMYQPGLEDDVFTEPEDSTPSSGLILVNHTGAVTRKKTPLSGETVVFAVHNSATNDAKAYQLKFEATQSSLTVDHISPGVEYTSEESATVTLPDRTTVIITQLKDDLLQQAVDELAASVRMLKGEMSPDSILSEEEKAAARSVALENRSY